MKAATHQPSVRPRAARLTKQCIVVAAFGVSAFVALNIALQLIQGGDEPHRHPVGQLVHGRYGWLFSISMVALGLGSLALALALRPLVDAAPSRLGLGFLVVWSIGCLLVAAAPAQPLGEVATTPSGTIHGVSIATVFAAITLASIGLLRPGSAGIEQAFPSRAWSTARWSAVAAISLLGLLVISWLGTIADSQVGSPAATWFGITERLTLAADTVLLIALALLGWRVTSKHTAQSRPS